MNRRTLLAGLGAATTGLAGCASLASSESTDAPTRTPPTCDTHRPRHVELVGTGDVPNEAEISLSASIERARPTPDDPAVLDVTLTNDGSRRELHFQDDVQCHPFNRGQSLSDPRGLRLIYHDYEFSYERARPCWTRPVAPVERDPGWDGYGCGQVEIESGESVTCSLEIWDDFRIDGYFPAGTSRFTTVPLRVPQTDRIEWWVEIDVTDQTESTDQT